MWTAACELFVSQRKSPGIPGHGQTPTSKSIAIQQSFSSGFFGCPFSLIKDIYGLLFIPSVECDSQNCLSYPSWLRVRGLYLITPAARSAFMAFAEQIQTYLRNIASFVTFLFPSPLLPSPLLPFPPMFTSTCAQFHSQCVLTILIQMVFHLSKAQICLKHFLFHFGSKSQLLLLSSLSENDAFAFSLSCMKSLTSLFDVLLILPQSPSQNLESCHH